MHSQPYFEPSVSANQFDGIVPMLEQSRNGRNRFVLGLVPCEIERGLRVEFAMQVFIGDVAWKSPDRGRWGHETKESLSSFSIGTRGHNTLLRLYGNEGG